MTSKKRNIIIAVAGLCFLAIGAMGQLFLSETKPDLTSAGFGSLADAEFRLVTDQGQEISADDLIGKPTAIYFGFTWCPDICPTTLSQMADIKADLMAQNLAGAAELQLVFFTVDPERDTVFQMSEYVSLFAGDIIGITGTIDQINNALPQFGVYAKRIEQSDGDYLIDHTASVYLYDRDGQFKGTISPAEPYEMALGKLERLAGTKG
ncbi:MAG: SCO family protein [Candidatus Puniceispirillaceae bacterium]